MGPSVDGRFNFFEISGFGGLYNILIMNNLPILSSIRDGIMKQQFIDKMAISGRAGDISGCQMGCYRSVNIGSE